jgi:ATP-dependent exoDNAse (exonuclease V) alpha subunit
MLNLTESQETVVESVLETVGDQACCIVGGAGSGKSTVIKHLQNHFTTLGKTVVSVAPTNSAAQNIDGHTICRWIGATPYYDKKGELRFKIPIQGELLEETHVPGDILIVDEAFMVQKEWIAALHYKQNNPQIIFVGDSNQLPPVKESESILVLNELPKYKIEGSQRFGHNKFLMDLADGLLQCTDRQGVFSLLSTIPKKAELYATTNGYTCLSYTNSNCDRLNTLHTSYNGLDPVYLGQKLLMDRTILDSNLFAKEEVEVTQVHENSIMLEGKALYSLYDRDTLAEKEDWRKALLDDPKTSGKEWTKFYKNWEPYITLFYSQFRTVHAAQGQTMDKVALCVNDFQKCREFPTLKRLAYTAVTRSTGNIIAI